MPKPTDSTLKIGTYQYKGGYSCHVLYRGAKPAQDNILLEASRIETIVHCLASLGREREGYE